MKLSVIVPCYNVEYYLVDCVESIIKAKVDNMEIILVNDGSVDDTLKVIKELKNKYDSIIKVVDKENGGLSSARNAGLKVATGEYVSFVDSDDTINENMYRTMLDKAIKEDFDMVVCGEARIFDDHTDVVDSGIKNNCYDKESIKSIMPYIYPAACNKIYKRSLFKNIKFTEGIWYEDVEFIYRLLPTLNSIGVVEGYFYNYYQRAGSITYTYNSKLYDLVDNMNSLYKYYKDNKLFKEYHDVLEYTYVRYLYATFIKRLSKMKNKEEYNKGVERVIKEVNSKFPEYRKNKYLVGSKGLYLKYFNKFIASLVYIKEKNSKN